MDGMIHKVCEMKRRESIVCRAFTDYTCSCCGRVYKYRNSGVPKICPKCSFKYQLCEFCGDSYLAEPTNTEEGEW